MSRLNHRYTTEASRVKREKEKRKEERGVREAHSIYILNFFLRALPHLELYSTKLRSLQFTTTPLRHYATTPWQTLLTTNIFYSHFRLGSRAEDTRILDTVLTPLTINPVLIPITALVVYRNNTVII